MKRDALRDVRPRGNGTSRQLEAWRAILTGDSLPAHVDWGELLETGRRHGVSPLLFWWSQQPWNAEAFRTLQDAGEGKIWDALYKDYHLALARDMLVTQQCREVLSALSQAGLRPMLVKGAAIARHYPRPELRPYGDIDVLLPQDQVARARDVLAELGYRAGQPSDAWLEEQHFHLPAMRMNTGYTVELHWRLSKPGEARCLPVGEVWTRARQIVLCDVSAWAMDPVDEVLHVCRHGVVQHRLSLGMRACYDLYYLTRLWGDERWEDLLSRARRYQLERPVYLLTALTDRTCRLPRAGRRLKRELETVLRVEPGFVSRMEATMYAAGAAPRLPAGLVRAAERPLWSRLRRSLFRIFLPPAAMAHAYHLPEGSPLAALYYVWRPIDLLRRHGRLVRLLLSGEKNTRDAWDRQRELETWLDVERPR